MVKVRVLGTLNTRIHSVRKKIGLDHNLDTNKIIMNHISSILHIELIWSCFEVVLHHLKDSVNVNWAQMILTFVYFYHFSHHTITLMVMKWIIEQLRNCFSKSEKLLNSHILSSHSYARITSRVNTFINWIELNWETERKFC